MSISSRTPEGQPLQCPLCGERAAMEVSPVTGDATCPACGQLLWEQRDLIARWRELVAEQLGVQPDQITLDAMLDGGLGIDSLESVELVMDLEEEFDLEIPPDEAENLQSLGEILRWLLKRRREQP